METMDEKRQMEGGERKENRENRDQDSLPLMALNHVSRICRDVDPSIEFYVEVLGFVLIKRPEALNNFNGAWLFNYGVGIHLVQKQDDDGEPPDTEDLDPMDNHIPFQCENIDAVIRKLEEMDNKYMKRTVKEESGAEMELLFFNDPDGFMIEICNCENVKLVPQGSTGRIKLPDDRHNPPVSLETDGFDCADSDET